MSYSLQVPSTIIEGAGLYAASRGTTLDRLVASFIVELSTRKVMKRKRTLGVANGRFVVPAESEDKAMDVEIQQMFEGAGDEVFA